MALISLWKSNPAAMDELSIEQIVATAGDGNLRDDQSTSAELKEYLSQVPSEELSAYVDHCLSHSFQKSGFVLQDLVNELGRRLDYLVENGRYQGRAGLVGADGVWASPEGGRVVVEVKATDAYRISLDTLAGYRDALREQHPELRLQSILIVVGREDTGELEAQVRGSRHAWDIRLISADALMKLVRLKENADELETGAKIRGLLVPVEYTRIDGMVDVMFATAADIEGAISEAATDEDAESENAVSSQREASASTWQFTDSALIQGKREKIVSAMEGMLGSRPVKTTRALYWDTSRKFRIACTISKRYTKRSATPHWYAYHPRWDEFLSEAMKGYFILGGMDLDFAFAIPWDNILSILAVLNITTTDRGMYWHIHITMGADGSYSLMTPRSDDGPLPLDQFRLDLH